MRKYDIINLLGRRHGLRDYLEICTPSTGLTFAKVDAETFKTCHRLVYRCPEDTDDGQEYTYRTTTPSSREITRTIFTAVGSKPIYDLIFVDPWHELKASAEDLEGAWQLLRPGGYIVVHDCNPPNEEVASPQFRKGAWCGETYRAYIDFLAFKAEASFCTIDTDFGCGVVKKVVGDKLALLGNTVELWLKWAASPSDAASRYFFFDNHRAELLQMCDEAEFVSSLA